VVGRPVWSTDVYEDVHMASQLGWSTT